MQKMDPEGPRMIQRDPHGPRSFQRDPEGFRSLKAFQAGFKGSFFKVKIENPPGSWHRKLK